MGYILTDVGTFENKKKSKKVKLELKSGAWD